MDHPIQELMDSAMKNIKAMVDVDTVVGDAVNCGDETFVIPISNVSFGFGAGGSDFMPKQGSAVTDKMFGGGCGGGANVKPAGFLVVSGGNIRYLPVSGSSTAVDKLIDLMPEMLDKVNRTVSEFRSKKQEKREKRQQEKESIEIID